jgi:hypothetical protein
VRISLGFDLTRHMHDGRASERSGKSSWLGAGALSLPRASGLLVIEKGVLYTSFSLDVIICRRPLQSIRIVSCPCRRPAPVDDHCRHPEALRAHTPVLSHHSSRASADHAIFHLNLSRPSRGEIIARNPDLLPTGACSLPAFASLFARANYITSQGQSGRRLSTIILVHPSTIRSAIHPHARRPCNPSLCLVRLVAARQN